MLPTLTKYYSTELLKYFLALGLIIGGLTLIIQFTETDDELYSDANGSLLTVLSYHLLNMPIMFSRLGSFIAHLAGILVAIAMIRYEEMKAIKAAGFSQLQLIFLFLPGSFLIAILHFAVDNFALPSAVLKLRELNIGDYSTKAVGQSSVVWVRSDRDIVRVGTIERETQTLRGVTIFRRNSEGLIEEQITGATAQYRDGSLHLVEAKGITFGMSFATSDKSFTYEMPYDFQTLWMLALKPSELPLTSIYRLLKLPNLSTRPQHTYEFWFNKRLSAPIATIFIVLLLVPLATRYVHFKNYFLVFLTGLAIGFVYFVLDTILVALGEIGVLSPFWAAWTPVFLLALLVALLSLSYENSHHCRPVKHKLLIEPQT
jgi:lipopolysaccharide export system permease protein